MTFANVEPTLNGDTILNSQSWSQWQFALLLRTERLLRENNSYRIQRKSDVWRNRSFREIRRIYLFSSRAICWRARRCEGAGSEKFTWRTQGTYCDPRGPLYLRQEPAGSCEHAPRMNRGYLFSFCRQTHRVWSIRMAIRFETTRERERERGGGGRERKGQNEKKIYFQTLAPGPLIRIDVRQVGVEVQQDSTCRLT